MKKVYEKVASIGMDVHYKFSNVAFRDGQGQLLRREKLDHRDCPNWRHVRAAPVLTTRKEKDQAAQETLLDPGNAFHG